MKTWSQVIVVLTVLLWCSRGYPHQVPNSVVNFDFGAQTVRAELLMPLSELRDALGELRGVDTAKQAVEHDVALIAYVLKHVSAASVDGSPWTIEVTSIGATSFDAHEYLNVVLALKPPEHGSARQFVWHDDAITHEVRNHFIMLVARSDFATGLIGADAQFIAVLQHPMTTFTIDRGAPQAGAGFRAAFQLGVAHIVQGTDHLLFLLTLLLPASLVAVNKHWQGRRTLSSALRQLVAVVTAFTMGHSVALAGSVAYAWQAPSQPIEILIAASILVSAIHASRPVFPGREPLIAGLFGVIHGLAFATALNNHVLDSSSKTFAILGFNLGIESVQILVILLAMPILYVTQPMRFSVPLRQALSILAGGIALFWIIGRLGFASIV